VVKFGLAAWGSQLLASGGWLAANFGSLAPQQAAKSARLSNLFCLWGPACLGRVFVAFGGVAAWRLCKRAPSRPVLRGALAEHWALSIER